MILVRIFPAQRTRDIVMLLSVGGLGALYMMFRLLRPERLVDPEAFFSIAQYLAALQGPDSPYLPTHWVTEALWAYLSGSSGKETLFQCSLLWSTAGAITVINVWMAQAIYFSGFSKSQEGKRRSAGKGLLDFLLALIRRPFKPETRRHHRQRPSRLFPRQHAVVAVASAGCVGGGICLQFLGSPSGQKPHSRRVPSERDRFPERGACRVRAFRCLGSFHLSSSEF